MPSGKLVAAGGAEDMTVWTEAATIPPQLRVSALGLAHVQAPTTGAHPFFRARRLQP